MPSKTTYTPGPWTHKPTASLGPQYAVYAENDPSGANIAVVYDGPNAGANARLIALAPKMAEALRACVELLEFMARDMGWTPEHTYSPDGAYYTACAILDEPEPKKPCPVSPESKEPCPVCKPGKGR